MAKPTSKPQRVYGKPKHKRRQNDDESELTILVVLEETGEKLTSKADDKRTN